MYRTKHSLRHFYCFFTFLGFHLEKLPLVRMKYLEVGLSSFLKSDSITHFFHTFYQYEIPQILIPLYKIYLGNLLVIKLFKTFNTGIEPEVKFVTIITKSRNINLSSGSGTQFVPSNQASVSSILILSSQLYLHG